jgi:hypothetical protein
MNALVKLCTQQNKTSSNTQQHDAPVSNLLKGTLNNNVFNSSYMKYTSPTFRGRSGVFPDVSPAFGGGVVDSLKLTRRSEEEDFLGDLLGDVDPLLLLGVRDVGDVSAAAERSFILPVFAKSIGSKVGRRTHDAKQWRPPIAIVLPAHITTIITITTTETCNDNSSNSGGGVDSKIIEMDGPSYPQ